MMKKEDNILVSYNIGSKLGSTIQILNVYPAVSIFRNVRELFNDIRMRSEEFATWAKIHTVPYNSLILYICLYGRDGFYKSFEIKLYKVREFKEFVQDERKKDKKNFFI